MANTKQAKKRAAQNEKQKARNRAVKSATRRTVKTTRAKGRAIASIAAFSMST